MTNVWSSSTCYFAEFVVYGFIFSREELQVVPRSKTSSPASVPLSWKCWSPVMTRFSNAQPTRFAPDEIIRPLVERYVASGYSNPEVISRLRTHKETSNFKISLSLLKKRRSEWGLKSTRGQAHNQEHRTCNRIHQRFPKQGSHDMKQTLLQEEQLMVPRTLILQYMNVPSSGCQETPIMFLYRPSLSQI
ncbi:uncharacterized protein F5147DRAFT_764160 [Suillus discolor]|uniref:Clr5 domain-containing protein n=1 Tax=Suillus discolor TaxID=1912936 RepID=A0A9P7EW53_9AGAM|nr:uncharacterized protein F5147DRAFT_764160 [Suillus discolor]KAG2092533.1 hypothetical protein F5147DRAFT_764160 [Suillus discolor]